MRSPSTRSARDTNHPTLGPTSLDGTLDLETMSTVRIVSPEFRSYVDQDFINLVLIRSYVDHDFINLATGNNGVAGVTLATDELAQLQREHYPYADLKDGQCPPGVDPCSKEVGNILRK